MKNIDITIKIPSVLLNQIKKDLIRPHEFASERIGFINSKFKTFENGKIIILLNDYHVIDDDCYIDDSSVGARINSDAIRMGMQSIINNESGCFHVHYHEFSIESPEFSTTDFIDNPEIVKSFSNVNKNKAHGMIVIGNNGLNAQVKLPNSDKLQKVDKIVEIGYPFNFSFPKSAFSNFNFDRYERQTFLGKNAQFLISNIKVGIVGLGGGGSHIAQQLSYLGINNYVLFDSDIVTDTNLNRMIGAGQSDVDNKVLKVDVAERVIKHVLPNAEVLKVPDKWQTNPEKMQQCDIIVGGVDTFIGRNDLEAECRRYLIPCIDIGMDVYNDYEDESPSMVGQILLSMPGFPCLKCLGYLNDDNLTKEAAKYGAAGGKPQVVWSNGVLASSAVGVLVDLITGWTGKKDNMVYYSYDGNLGTLSEHVRLKYVKKECLHYPIKDCGAPKFRKL